MPPPWVVGKTFLEFLVSGELLFKLYNTVLAILVGLVASVIITTIMTTAALLFTRAAYIVEVLTTIMHPMPSVAMIPLVIVWIGIGFPGVVALTINSCLWPIILNSYTGFKTVHQTYIEVGRNIGLKGLKLFWHVILPSALPYLITGIEISWARSWRAAIAVELVFGAATTSGGIGWTIYMSYFDMETPLLIAAIFTIAAVGVLAEKLVMETIEKRTVLRWGMVQLTETMGAR